MPRAAVSWAQCAILIIDACFLRRASRIESARATLGLRASGWGFLRRPPLKRKRKVFKKEKFLEDWFIRAKSIQSTIHSLSVLLTMRLGGGDDEPDRPLATDAYPSTSQRYRRVIFFVLTIFAVVLFRSSSRDYQADAEHYLRSVGRGDPSVSLGTKTDDIAVVKDQILQLSVKIKALEDKISLIEKPINWNIQCGFPKKESDTDGAKSSANEGNDKQQVSHLFGEKKISRECRVPSDCHSGLLVWPKATDFVP
jgi:hypothetical protein